tara:strand:+ start:187 stop:555 length:369 start_codon:yes stop_codon:yes gene_type:complete
MTPQEQLADVVSKITKNSERIQIIETELDFISSVIKTADGFIKGIKTTLAWSSFVFAGILSIFVWILLEKNGEFKEMQKSIVLHSIQINETLIILKSTIEKNDRRHGEIDAATGPGYGHPRK